MEKLDKKTKHNHKLTNILKALIFSMVMLAPFFSIATRCLYVICNKNAKDSYSTTYIKNLSPITSNNLLVTGSTYQINEVIYADSTWNTPIFEYSYINIDWTEYGAPSNYTYTGFGMRTGTESANKFIFLYENGVQVWENHSSNINILNKMLPFQFVLKTYTGGSNNWFNYFNTSLVTTSKDTLDNAFEYSLSQIEESNYYNWTTNLGIYEPINNMVIGLGGNSIISLLLAYWSIYTAIYIVFDIIIVCFTKLTHFVND